MAAFTTLLVYASNISQLLRTEITKSFQILLSQALLIGFAVYIVNSTASSLRRKLGLPVLNQLGSWTIFLSSFFLPLINSSNLTIRLSSIAIAFCSVYLLMSTAYEGLFLLVLSLLMGAWLLSEHKLSGKTLETLLETQLSSDAATKTLLPSLESSL